MCFSDKGANDPISAPQLAKGRGNGAGANTEAGEYPPDYVKPDGGVMGKAGEYPPDYSGPDEGVTRKAGEYPPEYNGPDRVSGSSRPGRSSGNVGNQLAGGAVQVLGSGGGGGA